MNITFKKFFPKVDEKRRLILTRFHSGVMGENIHCYQIHRWTKRGEIDKRFKPLYAFGSDDFDSVKEFKHSGTGEVIKVPKSTFKRISGVNNPLDISEIVKKVNRK